MKTTTICHIHDPTPIWGNPCSPRIASVSWLLPSRGPQAPTPKPYSAHEPDPGAVLVVVAVAAAAAVVVVILIRCPRIHVGQRMRPISDNKLVQKS